MNIILAKHNNCSTLYAYDLGNIKIPDSGKYAVVENLECNGYDLVRVIMAGSINDEYQEYITGKGRKIRSKVLGIFSEEYFKNLQRSQRNDEQ